MNSSESVRPGQSCDAADVMVLWVGGMNHRMRQKSCQSREIGLKKNAWLCCNRLM
ncbi:MAG TPA: hypothetical protein VE548_06825 [Nitrososphaeraceae archaeon]|nr:hypothetical protein [Nitrososphaeraceae archaeon]